MLASPPNLYDVWLVKQHLATTFQSMELLRSPAYGQIGHEMENPFQSHLGVKMEFNGSKPNVFYEISEILQKVAYTRVWPTYHTIMVQFVAVSKNHL